jgi:UDP-N-acetylglucosamine 2-epimerase (non-hydrolysing)
LCSRGADGKVRRAEPGGNLRTTDVKLVIGTRPEAIKLAPVARALARLRLAPTIVLTGQHPGLDPAAHGLDTFPLIHLDCRGREDPYAHVQDVVRAFVPAFSSPTSLLVVQGDTSSALGGALAAGTAGIALAHVEAGLRSHDRERPWPEEDFRSAIDARADLLFAPTELSAANLRREGVRGEIHVTGNTAIDAMLAIRPKRHRRPEMGVPRLLVTCHRRESWGAGLRAIAEALRDIAADGRAVIDVLVHPNPSVAGLMWTLLEGVPRIHLLSPCGHQAMLQLMTASDLVLSDSGGVQEEAAALGVPLLVLRERTERPEAIVGGNMILVGTDRKRIIGAVRRLLANPDALAQMARPAMPFGDGSAATRIAAIIQRRLGAVDAPAAIAAE